MRLFVPLGLCVCIACSSPSPPAETEAAAEAPRPTPMASERGAAMVDHFQESLRIKHAVIDGELDEVQAAAGRLSRRLAEERFPAPWRVHLQTTARLAEAAGAASGLASAAEAAGGLAAACGECHAATGGGPRFPAPGAAPRPAAHDPKSQMARHQWAADRMWEGLVSRSDAAWTAGAAALADAPLSLAELTADVELPEEVLGLGDRVHALGARAGQVRDWQARGSIYGEFLASCAACHTGGC